MILCSIAEQAEEHVAQLLRSSDEQHSRCRKMDVGGSEMLGRRGRNEGGREGGGEETREGGREGLTLITSISLQYICPHPAKKHTEPAVTAGYTSEDIIFSWVGTEGTCNTHSQAPLLSVFFVFFCFFFCFFAQHLCFIRHEV